MTSEESNKTCDEYKNYYSTAFLNTEIITQSKRVPFYLRVRSNIIEDIDLINNGLEKMPALLKKLKHNIFE